MWCQDHLVQKRTPLSPGLSLAPLQVPPSGESPFDTAAVNFPLTNVDTARKLMALAQQPELQLAIAERF